MTTFAVRATFVIRQYKLHADTREAFASVVSTNSIRSVCGSHSGPYLITQQHFLPISLLKQMSEHTLDDDVR